MPASLKPGMVHPGRYLCSVDPTVGSQIVLSRVEANLNFRVMKRLVSMGFYGNPRLDYLMVGTPPPHLTQQLPVYMMVPWTGILHYFFPAPSPLVNLPYFAPWSRKSADYFYHLNFLRLHAIAWVISYGRGFPSA